MRFRGIRWLAARTSDFTAIILLICSLAGGAQAACPVLTDGQRGTFTGQVAKVSPNHPNSGDEIEISLGKSCDPHVVYVDSAQKNSGCVPADVIVTTGRLEHNTDVLHEWHVVGPASVICSKPPRRSERVSLDCSIVGPVVQILNHSDFVVAPGSTVELETIVPPSVSLAVSLPLGWNKSEMFGIGYGAVRKLKRPGDGRICVAWLVP